MKHAIGVDRRIVQVFGEGARLLEEPFHLFDLAKPAVAEGAHQYDLGIGDGSLMAKAGRHLKRVGRHLSAFCEIRHVAMRLGGQDKHQSQGGRAFVCAQARQPGI